MSAISVPPPLLAIRDLRTEFRTGRGTVAAVQGVDLTIASGEIVGLVGESGCGKSVLAQSIMRLVQAPGIITGGDIRFDGRDVMQMSRKDLSRWRGRDVGMIFQQPHSCLNPVRRVGWQVAEPFLLQEKISRKAAWSAAIDLLRSVGIPAPAAKAMAYPHQLSGGQAQRVMIAIALALKPRLLIADEPTTALDVTIQAQILDLLRDSCRMLGTSLLLVTHDLGVVARLADRVAVMYAGCIVEEGPVLPMLTAAAHPYASGLIDAAPRLGQIGRLKDIPGGIPDLSRPISGCAFAPRCERRLELALTRCLSEAPPSALLDAAHHARCWAPRTTLNQVDPLHGPETRP
ncbi:ABC transporter ATP-binding protein [Rhizobium sp. VS19-DR104.2]|uniref:ABC transporter ATP-binding protein n=1 Tax=unclassified Rhizobium TaxID=2613769 RepID=UPI001C5B5416|nr:MULTISPECIES: ABC transporter ATP-binding protein [unclassified Rhizobium]MBZ5763409.1 ABC transporter ATP-binding protein [Rhizobium sp. VS19-DR96]MBZ5769304.1 ABC transporter ATP-binding protein [Rhizobium sp. VS19-DR129.2]MBZ5776887.1 ABC transporter ATP-binding protein [Rhizobium sp. VS19-DRK62.2]MBZ5787998.1 ABC transporter ATP-binding protein [Rhizobium sp. VS19-DR121]MBZ5805453.1 ABC transporter ATP-binding protein [Rhizobium sp. VS19-DR181]